MKESEADNAVLVPLARLLLTFILIALWIAIFLAVFAGLSTIPVLMMAGFLLAYVTVQYVRHRSRG
jgi:hypothetical protein